MIIYDKIIIGAGLYGLYFAERCGHQGQQVLALEYEDAPFKRATYINQARVHMGYHYPRSVSTAAKSAGYFHRFISDYDFCIHADFEKIYAISTDFSWTSGALFQRFCDNLSIRCDPVVPTRFFKPGLCDGAFLTTEYTFDAEILKNWFLDNIAKLPSVSLEYKARINGLSKNDSYYILDMADGRRLATRFLLNSTYASVNQIITRLGFEPFKIKYELCEMILCNVDDNLRDVGLTVMDGPFFSLMPFGKTGLHSLTAVTFTPHLTSYEALPTFPCQKGSDGFCSPSQLGNCNECPTKPKSAWPYMNNLARKYLRDDLNYQYHSSLFSMKPILMTSEISDSRPTVIRRYSDNPTFVSVLSGKINTLYDLDELIYE